MRAGPCGRCSPCLRSLRQGKDTQTLTLLAPTPPCRLAENADAAGQAQAMVMDTLGLAVSVGLNRAFRHSPRASFLLPLAVSRSASVLLRIGC